MEMRKLFNVSSGIFEHKTALVSFKKLKLNIKPCLG